MGTYRKRFNEKARSGQMAKLKELKRVRNKQFTRHIDDQNDEDDMKASNDNVQDSNAELIKPLTTEERDIKKRKLQELFTPKESKISRLKKKRLDKFIEHQLKREEKSKIIKNLQEYKIDTNLLTSSKILGKGGKQTKKEKINEALNLEKQGREGEFDDDILYEKHETKSWENESDNGSGSEEDDDEDDDDFESKFGDTTATSSSFIDHRPNNGLGSATSGTGFGFNFSNAKVVEKKKTVTKKKYNWRQRVEREEMKKHANEDELDFETTDEESEEEISSEDKDNSNADDISSSEDEQKLIEEAENDTENLKKFEKSKPAVDFRDWAKSEINKMENGDQTFETPKLNYKYEPIIRQEDLDDGLPTANIPIDESSKRKAFYVHVNRDEQIQENRMKLPVFGEEHKIMEAIYHNDIVIICGETGSGKTTQVPQFLYEAGFGNPKSEENPGMIGITQPRRVATVSMAERVSNELGDHGDKVAYQIRFDSNTKEDTSVKFMTDGILLREMMHDFRLTKYSSIIIDEAHERNINTDILIGMLSRCVKLRAKENKEDPEKNKKLKLIIMSATLRVSDFSENSTLFSTPPPILKVDARQYPVSVHFNRKTSYNYADEAFKKTCKIHQRLPPGAILIFMTGQQEITQMVKRLKKEFPFQKNKKVQREMDATLPEVKVDAKTTDLEVEDIDFSVKVDEQKEFDDGIVDDFIEGEEEEEEGFEETLEEGQTANDPLYVLPLYSLLPTKEQMKVFKNPPLGSRLCVVATNVAETSLTIPNVRYVVDCGRSKERVYNEENNVQSFEIGWVSKASANQRSGRAGRTGPGHCYRLYSSAVFERDFEQFSKPEILRMPVESIVLQMKSMAIHRIVNFPFPTPPDRERLKKATELLQYLGALDVKEQITSEGRKMNLFPLSPRYSKMLLVSNNQNCLSYVISIVSGLSVGDPFIKEHELGISEINMKQNEEKEDGTETFIDKDELERKKKLRTQFYKSKNKFSKLDPYSDVFRLLSCICALDYVPREQRDKFLRNHFLRAKVMEEIIKLRKQLLYITKSNTTEESIAVNIRDEDLKTEMPNEIQLKLLKQMICAGFVDQIAIRADEIFPDDAPITNRTLISNIPYVPVLAQKTQEISECFTYIHPSSILNNIGDIPPKFIVYHSLHKGGVKTRLDALCDIKSTPLANVAKSGSLLQYSKPLSGQGLKSINITPTERYCYVVPRFGSTINSDLKIGCDLNPIAVHQKKENGQWIVDEFVTNKKMKALKK